MGVKKSDIHFNTTNEESGTVKKYAEKNINQNNRVLEILKKQKKPMTASEVWETFGTIGTPLTSIRRALSTWKAAGEVEITEFKKEGIYGRPEYYYKLTRYGGKKHGNKVE